MVWARFDDQYPDHPKVIEAGPLAAWLNVCAICYSSRYLTDGFVPAGQVRKLADLEDAMQLAERLVAAGLWERVPGGFLVHDYLEYNPSREKVNAEREAARRRMNSRRSPDVRLNFSRTSGEVPTTFNDPVPVPVPVPVPTPEPEVFAPSERGETPPKPKRKVSENNRSWPVWERFCAVIGADPATHPGKGRAMGVIDGLLKDGYAVDDIIGCAAWLRTDDFERKRLDLISVRRRIDGYINDGRPTADAGEIDDDEFHAYLRGPIINGHHARTAD